MPDALAAQPPIKLRWFFGIVAVFLIFVVIAAYSSRMARDTAGYDSGRAAERYATLAKLRADDNKTLTTVDWVDQAKGVIRIPIDEAMPETVTALTAKPVHAGATIPGAAPAANTIPATAANSAPSTNAAPANPPKPTSAAPNK